MAHAGAPGEYDAGTPRPPRWASGIDAPDWRRLKAKDPPGRVFMLACRRQGGAKWSVSERLSRFAAAAFVPALFKAAHE